MTRKKSTGSRPPFGWAAIGAGRDCFIPVPAQIAVLRRIKELYDAEATIKAIADDLNAHGYRTQTGVEWSLRSVYRGLDIIRRFGIPEDIEAAIDAAYKKADEKREAGARLVHYSGRANAS